MADLLPYSCLCPSRLVDINGRVPRYALRLPSRREQDSDLDCLQLQAAIDATKLTEASICLGWDAISIRVLWEHCGSWGGSAGCTRASMQAITRADAWIATVGQAPCRNRVYRIYLQVIPSQIQSAARQACLHEISPSDHSHVPSVCCGRVLTQFNN